MLTPSQLCRKVSFVKIRVGRLLAAALAAVAATVLIQACSGKQSFLSPTSDAVRSFRSGGGEVSPDAVDFPPRNEPFDFRTQLEAKYRDQLRRGPTQTYVDTEGDIVWTTEYLRYRVNQCDHATAVQKVLAQINGQGVQPTCGNPPSGQVAFPPRNEPLAFRQQLDDTYRTTLRRGPVSTYVDIEGDIVWTSEYLRYRLNNCDHPTAVTKTFQQIDGQGVQPVCASTTPAPTPSPTPTPTPTPSPTPTPTPTPTPSPSPSPAPIGAPGLPSTGTQNGKAVCQLASIIHPAACVNNGFGDATAVCNDGARSCSTSNSGTCSANRGVYCWVCPGPLCP